MKTIIETDEEFVCDIDSPCFQLLAAEEIELVKGSKTQVLFRKGDNLTKQGAFASYVLFIVNGYARQYVEGDQGKSYNLQIVKPGDFVGLSAVFSKNTFDYSVTAMTDCLAFLVEKDAIAQLVQQNGMFGFGIIKRYYDQNSTLFDTLRSVLYRQMNGRLAETLLYINSFKSELPDVFQLLLRKEIADFAGISTESAVKLLKAFEKDGLIELKDKDINILNSKSLQEISIHG
ncbi:Crp/Fnr family transcriptional regulator [Sunxiuqinia sp. A32]|uniref:Crp/Fnr family transcriptional regulator n=1 Tax=Sunxiuqinia sp. A32 TaxID=3461496 RepID=UPI004045DBDB